MEGYVGVDVHSKASVFVIQDGRGQVLAQGEMPTTPEGFRRWYDAQQLPTGTPVALETGTVAFFVARQLTALGCVPSVIDAREVRLKAQRPTQKSDRRDAYELCDGLRRGIYRTIVHVPPCPVVRLRETLSRRRHFVRLETAQVNAVKRLLRGAGLGHRSRSLGTEVGWAKLLAALAGYEELRGYVALHHAVWGCARTQRGGLETALREQLAAPAFAPALRRLQTVPGVGPIVAATIVAVFSDVGRFADAKHAASYAGLVPSTYQSGDREAYGHITKRGSGELRAMLCEAAHHASRPTHPLHPYFARLQDGAHRRGPPAGPDHGCDAARRHGLQCRPAQRRGGSLRAHHHPPLPPEAGGDTTVEPSAETTAHRTQARARDPGLSREPRAQIAVWGRAPRSATWGGQRPRMDAW